MDVSFRTILKLFCVISISVFTVSAQEPHYGFCANPTCSEPIGLGIATLRYHPGEHDRMRLNINQEFDIYVKDYGEKRNLLGVVINGQKGYVPKYVVQEKRRYVRDLVPATVEFILNHIESPNQETSHIHISMSRQEVIHHVSPDAYTQEQNYHSNFPSESYDYHSDGAWADESSHIYASPHVHVISSHVEATVTSQTSNVAQQPNAWESTTSHIHPAPENSVPPMYTSGFQQGTHQNIAPQQQYSEPSYQSGYQQQSAYQNIAPEQQYFQSTYPSENQPPQFANKLQTSFSSQVQSNMPNDQNSYSGQMHTSNTLGTEAQNFVGSPKVDGTYSNYGSGVQHSPSGSFSAQHSSQHMDMNSHQYLSSYSSQNIKPQIDLSETIAALKAQGYNDEQIRTHFYGENANFDPSHGSYSGQNIRDTSYKYPSQPDYLNSATKIDKKKRIFYHSPEPSQSVSNAEEKNDIPSSTDQFYSSAQFQQPSAVSESAQQTVGAGQNSEGDDSGEVSIDEAENEIFNENTSKDLPLSVNDKVSRSVHPGKQKNVPSQFSEQVVQPLAQTDEPPLSHTSESNTISPSQSPETIIESKVAEFQQNKAYPDSSRSNFIPFTWEESSHDVANKDVMPNDVANKDVMPNDVANKNVVSNDVANKNVVSEDVANNDVSEDVANKDVISDDVANDVSDDVANDVSDDVSDDLANDVSDDVANKNVKSDDVANEETVSDGVVNDQLFTNDNFKESPIPDVTSSSNLLPNKSLQEKVETVDTLDGVDTSAFSNNEEDYDKSGLFFDHVEEILSPENVNETDTLMDKDQNSDLEKILNISELGEAEQSGYLNAYQIRNLKGEQENKDSQSSETLDDNGGNASSPEFDLYDYIENTVGSIRSFIEILLSWIPEPLYSIIIELENKGISPRVPVFTALSAIPCLLLIVALVYMKERSKEQKLIAQLAFAEKNVYTLSAEKSVLEEKLEKVEAELESCKTTLTSERKFYDDLKTEVVNLNQELEKTNLELESRIEEIKVLKEHEREFVKLIGDYEKANLEFVEEKNQLNNQLNCQDETICQLNDQLQEKDKEIKSLQEKKQQYTKSNEVYEEKITQLQQNCNQLLEEAEIWNLRVNELNVKLNEETQAKQQLEESLETKDSEIKSLTFLMESFKSFEELEDADSDEYKSKKEKLQCLLKSANISMSLQSQEEENKLAMQKLAEEKNKILDMEVELLEAKSEIDKLKLNYNQALQDKTEAQTKLEVLTNYFKDKEIQLQKQLGAQEVFREKREKDADSAERRIVLIEQENSSYKYQVASMKQEMEETERNLKSQIAAQEKKAHENWIAARAAERKLEDLKQEVTQLRQKLTLLERDQGNFINTSRDDIIRPIPQRIAGINDETINSQDINNSMDEPPGMYRMPLPPMMLPDMPRDRPLPPLPLPPPPFEPPMFAPPPFGPFPRDPMFNSEFRVTPPEFVRGRASTPPRGRPSAMNDNEMGPHHSSPLGSELRESRNSTPPHSLPDFHDIPPPPRSMYPPHRFPFRPPFRREFTQGPPRLDYQGENSQGRGTQSSSVPQENWAPSNSRV